MDARRRRLLEARASLRTARARTRHIHVHADLLLAGNAAIREELVQWLEAHGGATRGRTRSMTSNPNGVADRAAARASVKAAVYVTRQSYERRMRLLGSLTPIADSRGREDADFAGPDAGDESAGESGADEEEPGAGLDLALVARRFTAIISRPEFAAGDARHQLATDPHSPVFERFAAALHAELERPAAAWEGKGAERAAESEQPAASAPQAEPYPFDLPPSGDIVFSGHDPTQPIRFASLDRIVERLTHRTYPDIHIRFVFLLTYRTHCTPVELLRRLVRRYRLPTPPNLCPAQRALFAKAHTPVRIKVLSVIKHWIETYPWDWVEPGLCELLDEFCEDLAAMGDALSRKFATHLGQTIAKQLRDHRERRLAPLPLEPPPPGVDPLAALDERALAQQLALADFASFARIESHELLNTAWTKPDKAHSAPHVIAHVHWFNDLTHWVGHAVLSADKADRRCRLIARFVGVAHAAVELGDATAALAIYTGLSQTPVHRLKKTWAALGSKPAARFAELAALCSRDRNQAALRARMNNAVPPCVPHIGVFLGDLIGIDEGNANTVNGLVNFVKLRLVAGVIERLLLCQNMPYAFAPDPRAQHALQQLREASGKASEDRLYARSYEIQPRGT